MRALVFIAALCAAPVSAQDSIPHRNYADQPALCGALSGLRLELLGARLAATHADLLASRRKLVPEEKELRGRSRERLEDAFNRLHQIYSTSCKIPPKN